MYNIVSRSLLTLVFLICSGAFRIANAEEYNFHIGSFEECPNQGVSEPRSQLNNDDPTIHKMVTKYLDFKFDETTGYLTVQAQFSNEYNNGNGTLPTGFHFAVSGGQKPEGPSQLALIYFDARQPNNIKVLGYTYNVVACNCANYLEIDQNGQPLLARAGSWLHALLFRISTAPYVVGYKPGFQITQYPDTSTADQLFTSLGDNANYVIEKSVVNSVSNGVSYRTFKLVLNTTEINKNTPISAPSKDFWKGAQFRENIMVRFWAVNTMINGTVGYDNHGYLADYDMFEHCSVCGYNNMPTNTSPICKSVNLAGVEPGNVIRPGNKITATITANDKEKDNLQVNYSGQPSGSTFNVANNSIISPNASGDAQVLFDWIPGLNVNGKYNVNVKFTQQYGVNKAFVNCPFEFNVAGCEPTDWRETINAIDDDIAQQLARHHVLKLVRRIKNTRGRLSRNEKEIRDSAIDLGALAWSTLMSLQRDRVIRQNCGSQIPICDAIDVTRELGIVEQIVRELYGQVETLSPRLRKALRAKGITGQQNTRRWRPIFNSATSIRDAALVNISSLPGTIYACEKQK